MKRCFRIESFINKKISVSFLLFFINCLTVLASQNPDSRLTGDISIAPLPAQRNHADTAYLNHKDVFEQFGNNAERLCQQYGAFALDFLEEYKVEGLALLEKFGKEMASLHPLLDCHDIFLLYSDHGNNIPNVNTFSPQALSVFYKTFGSEGIKYIVNDPENFFLINVSKDRGTDLINLANEKGDIVFPLARKHGISFVRLYDKDVLQIVIKFQDDGLLALKEYGEKAKTLFTLFIDDDIFYQVIKTYGHKQTIPIIYLFYENRDFSSQFFNCLKTTSAYEWLSAWWYGTDTPAVNTINNATMQRENARRAINLIYELGNDFMDRFEILDINNVREEAVTIISNKLRNFFVSDIERTSRKWIRQEDINLEDKLFAGLDILGLIPVGSVVSKGTKLAVRGIRFAKTTKGFKGLTLLTEDLVATYGDDVIPFVAKHGDDGIKALKATDGKIIHLSQQYGDDVVRYVSQYGAGAGKTIEKYGDDALSLAHQYGDVVIQYIMLYEDDGIRVIQKYGKDVVLLSSVYGHEVIKLSALYGDDVILYVSKYGSSGVRSIITYGNDVIRLAKKHGDDVIRYVGRYGDDGLALAKKGKTGLFVMRFMPPKIFTKAARFTRYGLSAALLIAFVTHPLAFLSGLVKALAWLSGINPVIIAIIMGLLATFLLIRLLRRFLGIFHPMIVCLRALKKWYRVCRKN
ncbi:hypothetical protein BIY37_02480 [Candidatus Brocadia sapporoensis]|uniref:Uncharacterized protein n=1 Tax=Candidatus Brocadia sapporoensis TaxID=392547 RepID=A0A1V6M2G3_9BACT|nr:hypothetical protein [Candidatus Brocadia sapporoensis]MDG6005199.1 hypothetical protein [Candidatus Brocadia sp.]OQD46582.1 hypothetical protein BIY37_02480 [Candidatus Brocadia sapporoensis]